MHVLKCGKIHSTFTVMNICHQISLGNVILMLDKLWFEYANIKISHSLVRKSKIRQYVPKIYSIANIPKFKIIEALVGYAT